MVIKRNENIVARKIHGASFLIDISDNYSGDKCAIYEINETGMFIWNNIDGIRTVDNLVDILREAIIEDIGFDILHDDVAEFIDVLVERDFAEERSDG